MRCHLSVDTPIVLMLRISSMTSSSNVDRRNIEQKIAAMDAIRAEIEALTSDPETIRDTLEGEVDFEDIIDFLLADIAHNEALVLAIIDHMGDLKERASRLNKRSERERAVLKKALEIAKLSNCERPTATVSLDRKAPTLGTLDEALIPFEFWDEQPAKLNRDRLLAALKDKREVPGAKLAEESKIVKIRRG